MHTSKEITQIENHQVEIWRRPYQRSLNLSVRSDGSLRVTCGRRIAVREVARFVLESQAFIAKRLLLVQALRAKYPERQILSGETFLFYGDEFPLEVVWTWAARIKVEILESHLEMLAPLSSTIADRQKALRLFYRRQAQLHLFERVEVWARRMSLQPKGISIRGQKTRWGSCSTSGELSLNWKLLAAPMPVIDYVVIHELAHLQHMNHSRQFWNLVAQYDPHWKASRRWLKDHEYEIATQFRNSK